MIVCLCEGVSDKEVRMAIAEGASTLKAIGSVCGAGTGCRLCRPYLRQMLQFEKVLAKAKLCDSLSAQGSPENN